MPGRLSESTIALVKASVPALTEHRPTITRAMYARLLQTPEIRILFDQPPQGEQGSQPNALAAALLACAGNIDHPEPLSAALEQMAQAHAGLQIRSEHYPYVAEALLGAIREVLGDGASTELMTAWSEAYRFLANILISREAELNRKTTAAAGGWDGWRTFRVESRVAESEVITSFVLRPADGGPVITHKPGQYLTFLFEVPGRGQLKRTYTISSAPNGETYRISVKREPLGAVSQWLHDQAHIGQDIQVAPPSGDFVLPEPPERPVVLLSGGVGLTPMVCMLETIAQRYPGLRTFYVHGAVDGATHAFSRHVRELAATHDGISVSEFYSSPLPQDVLGRDFDEAGRITVPWLQRQITGDADYFICGPIPFLRAFVSELSAAGIPGERIHYEFFGTTDQLLEAWPEALDLVPAGGITTAGARAESGADLSRATLGEAILESVADAVIVSDRGGYIVFWNPGAERIFGFARDEAVGQSLDIIIPDSLRGRHWEGYHETAASGQSRYGAGDLLAVPALHKDGHRISVEFTITMVKDAQQRVEGMVSILRDVSARFEETRALRKKVQQLEAAAGQNTAGGN